MAFIRNSQRGLFRFHIISCDSKYSGVLRALGWHYSGGWMASKPRVDGIHKAIIVFYKIKSVAKYMLLITYGKAGNTQLFSNRLLSRRPSTPVYQLCLGLKGKSNKLYRDRHLPSLLVFILFCLLLFLINKDIRRG
jgi:hypothetical protein